MSSIVIHVFVELEANVLVRNLQMLY
ncbi:hypothetical protein JMJ77_0008845 [Colletotrichum scovillei]|uniref:Uncharacterized protein n=1 Tax=Colletotrichum scovillei TaxID=1209932 RepID=A0A9P7U3Y7_9PEZI|nr:hypothetical protein JMJ78_0001700 [Colletotrichum scovillei]KAG7041141.1 hypothetical protein JMJ77_0008845 [Colletotrichum scovillei]KAG7061175.1 hypothetical protein JMJ76_0010244 [Colletotrichum scovillei]